VFNFEISSNHYRAKTFSRIILIRRINPSRGFSIPLHVYLEKRHEFCNGPNIFLDRIGLRAKSHLEVAVEVRDEHILAVRLADKVQAAILDHIEAQRPSSKQLVELILWRNIEKDRELVVVVFDEVLSNSSTLLNVVRLVVLDRETEGPSIHCMGFRDIYS